MSILNTSLKDWITICCIHLTRFLKTNDSKSIIKKIMEYTKYCYYIDVIGKRLSTLTLRYKNNLAFRKLNS